MASTNEKLVEARKKAILSPNIGKHGKRKATIEKERRRAIFDEELSQNFIDIIPKARAEYLLDQFIGKAPDSLDITTAGKSLNLLETDEKIRAIANRVANEILKEQVENANKRGQSRDKDSKPV